ncbi:molecular chaperone HtpG [bacterium]|nr:molecular chaperone HtpG [bacterium]
MVETNDTEKDKTFYEFQAEVSRVMDIVINSLYTDREIFVRELISNAADALEKMRHVSLTEHGSAVEDVPLEVRIELNEKDKSFTITDTGIGMIRDELVTDLGRIAFSGSREFLEKMADQLSKDVHLIGQFGVGFYSVFMVARQVTVRTKSYLAMSSGYEWTSSGASGFHIREMEGLPRGTSITLELRDDAAEFAQKNTIQQIIRKYSNFVSFPIRLDGEKVNTIQAIWARTKQEISPEEYTEFYKYIAGAVDGPLDTLHFSTDAPLSLQALLFIPRDNFERFGFGKTEPGVDLHCRKILIEKGAQDLLPPWLRFVKGVVDSEDLPLNISRETMQDTALIRKINRALTSRFLKFLEDKSASDRTGYEAFWKTFGSFIKEGIISDYDHRTKLAGLLRYETSTTESGTLSSLDEYIARMKPDQKEIYFMTGPDRRTLEASPYLEVFKERSIEVLLCFDAADDFVMTHLENFSEKKLVSVESARLDLPKTDGTDRAETDDDALSSKEQKSLTDWIRKVLKDKVAEVRVSHRLVGSPVLLVTPDARMTGSMQRLLEVMNKDVPTLSKLTLEYNPSHHLIRRLEAVRGQDARFAETIVEQLLDQAAFSAGYSVQSRAMIDRMSIIMERALDRSESGPDPV